MHQKVKTSKLSLVTSLDWMGPNFSVDFCTACNLSQLGILESPSESENTQRFSSQFSQGWDLSGTS